MILLNAWTTDLSSSISLFSSFIYAFGIIFTNCNASNRILVNTSSTLACARRRSLLSKEVRPSLTAAKDSLKEIETFEGWSSSNFSFWNCKRSSFIFLRLSFVILKLLSGKSKVLISFCVLKNLSRLLMKTSSSAMFSSVKYEGKREISMKLKYSLRMIKSFFLRTMLPLF